MKLIVNGELRELEDGAASTVRALLRHMDLADQPVAVELNRELVPRPKHEATELREGDTLELVTLVGGG